MTYFIVLGIIALVYIIIVQIGKVVELSAAIRGEKEAEAQTNNLNAVGFLTFLPFFLGFTILSFFYYWDSMLGYGIPSASKHGVSIDSLFNVTMILTGIVFIFTHILLFWFSYKYRQQEGVTATHFAHDTTLEVVWTAIPAIVLTFLVISGLVAWNEITADIPDDAIAGKDYMEVEAVGKQFSWILRYPGEDNLLGTRNYKLINDAKDNPIGQDWNDTKNDDDFMPDKLVLPVGKQVRVRINALDVLHNFYLPHFRVKMDAVPGMPTYFVFTPTTTTKEYRKLLSENPTYQGLSDPTNPSSKEKWEVFDYELACAELCGNGHYAMKRIVEVVTEEEYQEWLTTTKSHYRSLVMGTDNDAANRKEQNKAYLKALEDKKAEAEKAAKAAEAVEVAVDTTVVGE